MAPKKISIIIAVLIVLNFITSLLFGTKRLAEKGFDYFVHQTNYLSMHSDSVLYLAIIENDSIFLDISLPEKAGNKIVKIVSSGNEQGYVLHNQFLASMNSKLESAYPIIVIHKNLLFYSETEVCVFQHNKDSEKPIGYVHDYLWFFWDWIEVGSEIKGY
ncbi:MAG: hypothetical protein L6Q77_00660 [Bacteroidetes bacterium]|nr:hypothetical protein [Bacteroidota bacterium]